MNAFTEVPQGRRGSIIPTGGLPVEGAIDIDLPLEQLWQTFCDVSGWHLWNPCIWRATVTGGRISSRSCSIHQRQASISPAPGLEWMRFLPRATNLKCLTALVT